VLGDSDRDVRRAAAWALGKLGDPQAVPPLSVWAHAGEDAARDALQTLGHPMLDLPQAVAQVAAQGAWGVLIRALTCTQVREVVVGLGAPAVPALIQALGDEPECRMFAVRQRRRWAQSATPKPCPRSSKHWGME
jgi:HEAT repeat protein